RRGARSGRAAAAVLALARVLAAQDAPVLPPRVAAILAAAGRLPAKHLAGLARVGRAGGERGGRESERDRSGGDATAACRTTHGTDPPGTTPLSAGGGTAAGE